MTEELKSSQPGRDCSEEPVGRASQSRKVQIKEKGTLDPEEKLVPNGLGRPVRQEGLPHACWLESARQLDQPRTW